MKHLKDLILKLSPTEKRYLIGRIKENRKNKKLTQLFNVYIKGETLDSKYIEKKLGVTQIGVYENRLYNTILDILCDYNKNSSIENELKKEVAKSKVLFHKGMFEACDKLLKSTYKKAEDAFLEKLQLEILEIKAELFKEKGKFLDLSSKELENVYSEQKDVLKSYGNHLNLKYNTLNFLLISRNKLGKEFLHFRDKFDSLITSYENSNEFSYNVKRKIFVASLKAMYSYNIGEFKKSRDEYYKIVNLIEGKKQYEYYFETEYFTALNNLLILASANKDVKQIDETVKKIIKKFGGRESYKRDFIQTTMLYQFGAYFELRDIPKIEKMVPEIEETVKKFEREINWVNYDLFCFNLSVFHFIKGNLAKSNQWITKLINNNSKNQEKIRSNNFYYAQLFKLYILIESRNEESLEWVLPRTKRILNKIRKPDKFDKILIELAENYNDSEEKSIMTKYLKKLKTIKNEVPVAQSYFDFILWIETKIAGKNFKKSYHL